MANDLSTLGLRAANTVWNSSAGLTAVPRYRKLGRPTSGPAGLLLKRIQTLQEAVTLGGLYIQSNDATKWMFLAGTTLLDAIAQKTIGKMPNWSVDANGNPEYDLLRRKRWYGHLIGYRSWQGSLVASRDRGYYGGDVMRRASLQDFFTDAENVSLYGLVTSATEGMGHSGIGGEMVHSYLATCVPMNVPFSQYMTDIKASQLAAVPEKVRDYYARTFDTTLAAFPGKDGKPTLAVTTIWEGTTEVAPVKWKPPVLLSEKGNPVIVSPAFPHYSYFKSGLRDPSSLQYPKDSVYDDIMIPNPSNTMNVDSWSENEATVNKPMPSTSGKARNLIRPGYPGSPNGSYVGPILRGPTGIAKDVLGLQTGVVGGLHVGYLRDFHVLGRSLVDGQRYALETAHHESIAALIIETLDDQRGDPTNAPAASAEATIDGVANVEEEAAEIIANEEPQNSSIYQRGTLAIEIARFSKLWDANAKALAKREN